MRVADDLRTFVRRLPDLFQIGAARIIRRCLGKDEFDESKDDREMVTQCVYGGRIKPALLHWRLHRRSLSRDSPIAVSASLVFVVRLA
jgi:hypothetical protein